MTSERIKEIHEQTAYPESVSVKQALLQVWNECEQEQLLIQGVSNRFKEEQFITNTCFSYRHDYGLMLNKDKDKLRFECSEWMRAIKNSETH